jgi:hypothetical protein
MSDHQPPAGATEYLESGGGGPLVPLPDDAVRRSSRRTTWWVGGGLVGALAVGAGAWAALSFFQQGAQPAEALPASTVAYAALDLDPSGGQKIDAFRTLNKFPAFKDKVGIHSVDDVRRKLGEEVVHGLGCDGVTYDHDIEPWLGDRAAVAMVDLGRPDPQPVVVVQVTDEGKARVGLDALTTCGAGAPRAGFEVHDGWAVLAQTQAVADATVAATQQASLADDATYQKWTKAVGDAGVVNLYAAPAAGDYLARQLSHLENAVPGLSPGGVTSSSASAAAQPSVFTGGVAKAGDGGLQQALASFQGAAATIRFTGSALELASASDPAVSQSNLASDQGGAAVSRLPDDTAAAFGLGLRSGWFTQLVDRMAMYTGGGRTAQQLTSTLARESGLDLPADLETLLGTSAALSIGHDFDYEAAAQSPDGRGVPVALTVQGDPAAVEKVLAKIRARQPGSAGALGSDSAGDLTVIGPTQAYRQQILSSGTLGDSDTFRSVVPDAGHAGLVVYLDLDLLQKAAAQLTGQDPTVIANVAPLRAFGFSAWNDGGVARTSLRISTD